MKGTRIPLAWILTFAIVFLANFLITSPGVCATTVKDTRGMPAENQAPASRQGLVAENGAFYYYNEDGSLFTGGYKELAGAASTDYYYFLRNGQAFTSGYKAVELNGIPHYFFFDTDGKAFTEGIKEILFGDQSYYYYFQTDGTAVTSGFASLEEATYYFGEDGRAVRNSFVTADGNLYYLNEAYQMAADGWFCVDGMYYFATETGALATGTVVDGYKLDTDGKAPTKSKILAYVKEHTNAAMTNQEKIDALYYWIQADEEMHYISSYEHIEAGWNWPESWVDDFAVSMIDQWGGNCFRYAAFLGLLIREATGLPVTVYHGALPSGNPHGWTTVYQDGQWYAYDVQQDRQGLSSADCYKVPYPGGTLQCDGIGTALD